MKFEENIYDIVTKGFWPENAARHSQYIFDQNLFKFFDLLQKTTQGYLRMDSYALWKKFLLLKEG